MHGPGQIKTIRIAFLVAVICRFPRWLYFSPGSLPEKWSPSGKSRKGRIPLLPQLPMSSALSAWSRQAICRPWIRNRQSTFHPALMNKRMSRLVRDILSLPDQITHTWVLWWLYLLDTLFCWISFWKYGQTGDTKKPATQLWAAWDLSLSVSVTDLISQAPGDAIDNNSCLCTRHEIKTLPRTGRRLPFLCLLLMCWYSWFRKKPLSEILPFWHLKGKR